MLAAWFGIVTRLEKAKGEGMEVDKVIKKMEEEEDARRIPSPAVAAGLRVNTSRAPYLNPKIFLNILCFNHSGPICFMIFQIYQICEASEIHNGFMKYIFISQPLNASLVAAIEEVLGY